MTLVDFVKRQTPWPFRRLSRRIKPSLIRIQDPKLDTKELFTKIYTENLWGEHNQDGNDIVFYSGPGSSKTAARPYTECVRNFIAENGIRSVVDLGCGDFRVGHLIANPLISYIGIDIVEPLIEENLVRFGNERIDFRCLDAITSELPDGDLCLV